MTDKTLEVTKQEAEVVDGQEPIRSRRTFVPAANIYETENQFLVVADLPGVDEKSLDITLEKNVLDISGYVKPFEPEGFTLAYGEYEMGDFHRKFILSDEVDREHINASIKDGLLRLELTKAPDFKARKISVKAG